MTLCRFHNMTPFELFKQDTDEVIMIINYYIEKGEDKKVEPYNGSGKKHEQRIRVNDKTATGGWY